MDNFTDIKLGIIAGGQLAKMLIQDASKWDIKTFVLDNDETCPASDLAYKYIKGSHLDYDAVYSFGQEVDVLTYEIENINVDALKKLKQEGVKILPDPNVLELIKDKGKQKEFYKQNSISTSPFKKYTNIDEIKSAIKTNNISYPFVQKLRVGGYDGRGVSVIKSQSDIGKLLNGPSIIEEMVEISKEIAVIAARNKVGEVKCYPVVEMVFDPEANLVDKLICPSQITEKQAKKAIDLSSQLVELLGIEGIIAIELFIDKQGEVIVNEIAPRPHNSGHHTIESVMTSQFEQHIRAVLNLPLGSTEMKLPAVMVNILGEEGYTGRAKYEGLKEALALEGVKIHLYGKELTKPFRKMGHVTILDKSLEKGLQKAEKIKKLIKVKAWDKN